MVSYVSKNEYLGMGFHKVPEDEIVKYLKKASRVVDGLTFGRIGRFTLERLTDFQCGTIKEVVCKLADFYYENAEYIDSVFDSYSINSVSMHIGAGMGVEVYNGVPVPKMVYAQLEQTGLCCRLTV